MAASTVANTNRLHAVKWRMEDKGEGSVFVVAGCWLVEVGELAAQRQQIRRGTRSMISDDLSPLTLMASHILAI